MPTIADLAAKFRKLGEEFPDDLAEEAADDVERWGKRMAKMGKAPNGAEWPPKKDGSRALPNAEKSITCKARGDKLIITVDIPYAYHKKKWPILPRGNEPGLVDAVNDAAKKLLESMGLR